MTKPRWEHFAHQADIGVRGIGATRDEAFQQAALALTAVITDPRKIVAREPLEVNCEADDEEMLFVDWLNRLIYEISTRKMLFSRFDIWVHPPTLRARIWGEPIHPARHRPAVEVKAATYHELVVRQTEDGLWIAQCVVDV